MKKIIFGLCIILFSATNLYSQEVLSSNALQADSVTTLPLLESEVFNLINKHRAAKLLKPLRWSSLPAHLARLHSKNMAAGLIPFSHQGADARFAELRKAMPSINRFGENVAYNLGYKNPSETAFQGWLKSPGHYANILGDYNISGIGVAVNAKGYYYFTQVFAKENETLKSFEENLKESVFEKEASVSDIAIEWEENL